MTTSANVVEYRIMKDEEVVGRHRQHCYCKTHWDDLCKFSPLEEHTIIAHGLDEHEAPWEGEKQSLMSFLEDIPKSGGKKLVERDGFAHWETLKGALSQGFSSNVEAVLAYHTGLVLWRYVRRGQLSNIRMAAGNEKRYPKVIIDNILKEWVGIGWVGDEPPTVKERAVFPTVIDDI